MLPSRSRAPYVCLRCLKQSRSFVSTPSHRAIEPESPRYIDFPEPPQQTKAEKPRIKGRLPVPRDVLRGRAHEALAKARPDPEVNPKDPRLRFRAESSALRKSNLRQSIQELQSRKARNDEKKEAERLGDGRRSKARYADTHFSDRLTATTLDPTVTAEMTRLSEKGSGRALPDPDREARLHGARERVRLAEEARKEKRQDDLHTLYMNARTFIVDKEGLEDAIVKAFGTEKDPRHFGSGEPSIWANGAPTQLQEMLGAVTGARDRASGERQSGLLKNRLKQMAERLTGGKMDA